MTKNVRANKTNTLADTLYIIHKHNGCICEQSSKPILNKTIFEKQAGKAYGKIDTAS